MNKQQNGNKEPASERNKQGETGVKTERQHWLLTLSQPYRSNWAGGQRGKKRKERTRRKEGRRTRRKEGRKDRRKETERKTRNRKWKIYGETETERRKEGKRGQIKHSCLIEEVLIIFRT